MNNFWSLSKKYPSFRQVGIFACMFITCGALAQTSASRAPASYIPDDDVIVKPVENEISFYQRFVLSDNSNDVVLSRNQIKIWNDNQIFAQQNGLDTNLIGSAFYVPTQKVKMDYFQNKYMRYLRGKGEESLRGIPQGWYQEFRASNEVDTIDEMESRFKKSNKGAKGSFLPKALQESEVRVSNKISMIYQARLDQGLAIVGFKTPYAYARAFLGVNGKSELIVQQTYDSIGMRIMYDHYIDQGMYFTSVDQRIIDNIFFRVTVNKDPKRVKVGTKSGEDNTFMMLYAKAF
jgi:hypothetical protein